MQDQRDDARTRVMLLEGELRELQETDTQQQMYDLQNQIDTLRQDKARLEQQLRTFDQMKQMLQG
jgi:FtsZ-binding cell division protein ZapB